VRPLLLGECPSAAGDRYHAFPLSGAVGRRLAEWAGIEPDPDGSTYGRFYWPLRERFDCANVFDRHRDATPWSAPAARDNWAGILGEDYPEVVAGSLVVVCLGRRVADAVGVGDLDWFEWVGTGFGEAAVIPHPSGRNRLYNDPENRRSAGLVLRAAIERTRVAA
jgi:hypothetical protein